MIAEKIGVLSLVLMISLVLGCEENVSPQRLPQPPSVPEAVNCCLPTNKPIYFHREGPPKRADVGVSAYCKEVKEYAKTVQGDWVNYWYEITCRVIKITDGQWAEPNLVFVSYDSWPTSQSGILVKKAEFPYRTGKVFHFWLNTSKDSALIVGQQQRSVIPPHGVIKRPFWDFKDSNRKQIYDRIMKATTAFLDQQKDSTTKPRGALKVIEETHDAFVVEHYDYRHSFGMMLVDKGTYKVRLIPPFSK